MKTTRDQQPEVVDTVSQAHSLMMPDAGSAAAAALSQAMDYCAKKMGLANGLAAVERLRQGDSMACQYCHYSMAQHVAATMGALDDHMKVVYILEYDDTPDDFCTDRPASLTPLHLLAWAQRKTDALVALTYTLDRALAQALAEMIGTQPAAHVLDVQVIDDQDVERCVGYGALLRSIHNRPLKVWER